MQNDPRYDEINFQEVAAHEDHECAPYVGISHTENACVYCKRYLNDQYIKEYLIKKVSL